MLEYMIQSGSDCGAFFSIKAFGGGLERRSLLATLRPRQGYCVFDLLLGPLMNVGTVWRLEFLRHAIEAQGSLTPGRPHGGTSERTSKGTLRSTICPLGRSFPLHHLLIGFIDMRTPE